MNSFLVFGISAVGLTLTLALAGCADKEAQRQAQVQMDLLSDEVAPVTFVNPEIRSIDDTLAISGPLQTLDEVQLGAKLPGRLVMVSVSDGSRVSRGQVIARVEDRDAMAQVQQAQAAVEAARSAKQQAEIQAQISPVQSQAMIRQAEAGLAAAKAQLDLVRAGARQQEKNQARERVNEAKARLDKAKADLDRAHRLFAEDAIARADVEAAQLNHDSAMAAYRSAVEANDQLVEGARPEEIRQAEESVRRAEEEVRAARANALTDDVRRQQVQQADASLRQAEATLRLAQMQLADTAIISPIDGYVSGRPAQVGQVVGAGTPVATIVGIDGVYFEGQLPEREISRVRVGQHAAVTLDAFPDRVFDGTVAAIRPRADAVGRQFAVRVALRSSGGVLRPGMFGRASLVLQTISEATVLPIDAIIRDGEEAYVFVAEGDRARRVDVQLGRSANGYVQVTGVGPGDKVVFKGKDVLTDGAEIREDALPRREANAG